VTVSEQGGSLTVAAHPAEPVGMTITDRQGNNLVFERWPDGHVSSWSLDNRDLETRSVQLTFTERRLIAAFLLDGLPSALMAAPFVSPDFAEETS
jgi:hypothetical protein